MGFLEILVGVAPIPTGKIVVKNYDPYNLEQKKLSPISTDKEEIMLVHSDLLKDGQ